jgi:hypothetical protein
MIKQFRHFGTNIPENDSGEYKFNSFEGIANINSTVSTSMAINIDPLLYEGVDRCIYRDEPLHITIKKEMDRLEIGGIFAIVFNQKTGKTMLRGIKKNLYEQYKNTHNGFMVES